MKENLLNIQDLEEVVHPAPPDDMKDALGYHIVLRMKNQKAVKPNETRNFDAKVCHAAPLNLSKTLVIHSVKVYIMRSSPFSHKCPPANMDFNMPSTSLPASK